MSNIKIYTLHYISALKPVFYLIPYFLMIAITIYIFQCAEDKFLFRISNEIVIKSLAFIGQLVGIWLIISNFNDSIIKYKKKSILKHLKSEFRNWLSCFSPPKKVSSSASFDMGSFGFGVQGKQLEFKTEYSLDQRVQKIEENIKIIEELMLENRNINKKEFDHIKNEMDKKNIEYSNKIESIENDIIENNTDPLIKEIYGIIWIIYSGIIGIFV
jgi:hypothetical protein